MAPGDHRPPTRRKTEAGVVPRTASLRGVSAIVCDEQGRTIAIRLAHWLAQAAPARARGLVNIAIVSDARVRTLNREYRRLDYPTDVLSFPAESRISSRAKTKVNTSVDSYSFGPARRRVSDAKAAASNRVQPTRRSESRPFLGDIVIARGVARRQARSAGHDERTELRVLALHGLLHLLGYDHEHDTGQMARLERRLRRRAGLTGGLIERAAR